MRSACFALLLLLWTVPAQGQVPAYPRNDATKIMENDKVVVWNVVWPKGEPTPLHRHDLDAAAVVIEPGTVQERAQDGAATGGTPNSLGQVVYQPKGMVHIEEGTSDTPRRAIIVEFKDPAPPAAGARGGGQRGQRGGGQNPPDAEAPAGRGGGQQAAAGAPAAPAAGQRGAGQRGAGQRGAGQRGGRGGAAPAEGAPAEGEAAAEEPAEPPAPPPPPLPPAFPRPGATQLVDNARATIWDYKWQQGQATEMHNHTKDAIYIYLEPGWIAFKPRGEGDETTQTVGLGLVNWVPANSDPTAPTNHSEVASRNSPRAIIIELK